MGGSETRVVFLPRDPQWAYVFWEISDTDRKVAQKDGASRLVPAPGRRHRSCRTAIAHPTRLQEVPVDSHSTEWYLPVPLCDRDYRVELGYRIGSNWMSLAFSSVARVPALHPSEQILDQFVPFSLDAAPAEPVAPLPSHRLSPATAVCTSGSTKAPRFTSADVGLARKNSRKASMFHFS